MDGLLATYLLNPDAAAFRAFTRYLQTLSTHLTGSCVNVRGGAANVIANKTSTWDIWVPPLRWHHLVCLSSGDGGRGTGCVCACRRGSHSSLSPRLTRGEAGHTCKARPTLILATGFNWWESRLSQQWNADWSVEDAGPTLTGWLMNPEAAAETAVHQRVGNSSVQCQQRQSGDRKHE